MKKRIFSLFLALALCLTLLPGAAWVVNVAEVTVNGTTTQYSDIDAAFEAAQAADSATVKLLANVTISHTNDNYGIKLNYIQGETTAFTLELNGKTLSQKSGISSGFYPLSTVFCLSDGSLTIRDSKGGGKIVQPNGGPVITVSGGTLTVENGVIENTSTEDYLTETSLSDGGKYYQTPNCAVLIDGGEAVIKDGALRGMRGVVMTGMNGNYGSLTVTGGTFTGTSGNALIVYGGTAKLSGGSFSNDSTQNEHSIWVANGNASDLLANGYRYESGGKECTYSTDGSGVVGSTEVKERPANEYTYIDENGNEATQAKCTEITADTTELTSGWYAVNKDVTISGDLSVTGPEYVNLILCDGATLTVTGSVRLKNNNYSLNIYGQSEHTGTLKAGSAESTVPAIVVDESVGSSGFGYLYIYGGTVTVQAKAGTYSIGKTLSGQNLTFKTVREMKTVKTDNQNSRLYWYDNSGVSLTITKCKDHVLEYKNQGDRWHSSYCALCWTSNGTAEHNFNKLEFADETTHTFSCVCGAVSTEKHPSLSESPNEDGLTHSGRCGQCGYSTAPEKHNFQYSGMCICSAYLTASYDSTNYATLSSAVAAAAETGGTVMLEKNVGENITIANDMTVTIDLNGKTWSDTLSGSTPPLTVTGGSVTLQNGTLQISTGAASTGVPAAVRLTGGQLTVGEGMTIRGDAITVTAVPRPAIEVAGGELTLPLGAKLDYGMKVSAEGKTLADYLPEGTAFTVDGSVINGYVQEQVGKFTLTAAEHAHSYDADSKCACGFVCEHKNPASDKSYLDEDGVCKVCGKQVHVAKIGDKTYESLVLAFDDIGGDGSTTVEVELLTDVKESVEFNKSFDTKVTLKMNGHSLTSANDGPALTVIGGTLKFEGPVKINGGLLVTDGALDGGLPLGSVFTRGSNSYSIRWSKSEGATDVFNLRAAKDHAFAAYDSSTGTTGDIIETSTNGFLDTWARQIQMDVQIVQCDHSMGFSSGYAGVFCKGCMSPCPHKSVDEQNKCTECKTDMVAKGSSGYYYSLADDAFLNAANGDTVTLLADVKLSKSLFMNADSSLADKSVTLVMNGKKIYSDNNVNGLAALAVNSGKLTISDAALFSIPVSYDSDPGPAVLVDGGTLELETKATILGGLKVTKGSGGKDGTLEGGLKEDTVITANGTGSNCYSVSVEGSSQYTSVLDLLGEGLAFAEYNAETGEAGSILRADKALLTGNVIVVKHTHSYTDGVCDCGYACPEHNFTDGVCTVCGYVCLHPGDKVVLGNGGMYKCNVCLQTMVVKVEKDGTTTYYAKNSVRAGDTLWLLFNNALESGSTVTLLADNLYAWAFVSRGKQITLNLNGKTLDATDNNIQGITVGQGDREDTTTNNKLIVTGKGKSKGDDGYSRVFHVCEGGELVFGDDFSGTFDTVYVNGGKLTSLNESQDAIHIGTLDIYNSAAEISFKSGTFDKICFTRDWGEVTLGDLLAENSGCAFQYVDGDFVRYDTPLTSSGVENVTIATCTHDSITNGTCDYCGTEHIVAMVIDSGGTIRTYAADSNSETDINAKANAAFNSWNDFGGTLKLFVDFSLEDRTITNADANVIDLNGHTITGGTLTLADGTNVTITDSSAGKTGSFTNITVGSGASLTVDGISVGKITAADKTAKITLKEGTKFTGYKTPSGMILADWIEEGYGISGANLGFFKQEDTGNYTVTKAPATITASSKSGEVEHSGFVPTTLLPTIEPTGTTPNSYRIGWYRRTDTDTKHISSCVLKQDRTFDYYTQDYKDFKAVAANDQLKDVFCIITAGDSSGSTLWQTVVRGYTLTVTKGTAQVTTLPKAAENLTYNGKAQALLSYGGIANNNAVNNGMRYSLEKDGPYSADIPQGTDAKEYIVWYRAEGNENLDPSQPQSITVTIAPKVVTAINAAADSKTYDGSTAARNSSAVIDGKIDGDDVQLTIGEASFSDKNAGTGKTVTLSKLSLTGEDAANYNLTTESVTATADITPKKPTSFHAELEKKYYDGTNTLIVTKVTVFGTVSGDDVYVVVKDAYFTGTDFSAGSLKQAKVEIELGGRDAANYQYSNVLNINATIYKATPTGAPKYTAITASGKTLADAALTAEGGTFSVEGTVKWVDEDGNDLSNDTEVKANTAYKWMFMPTNSNYSTIEDTIVLYPVATGPVTIKTETTTNPDGSITKKETKSDGSTVETTTSPDGSTSKTTTKRDGSSVTKNTDTDGSTGTVRTDKNGSTTAEANLSGKALSEAEKTGEAVKVPAEVTPGEDSASAPTVKINLPAGAGETEIEIPVKDMKPGTVAIIVHPDGTEEIVKDCVPTQDGIRLTVEGDVTVKIVNNAKGFTDIEGHWAKNAIDFVSARGLVDGVSETQFAPEATATRAQLWVILARQAGVDLTGGGSWYEKAQEWAVANGISDGYRPDGTITRAQAITLLWRAAGSPEAKGAGPFTDVPADSYYAKAVAWAAEKGITLGTGGGKFSPDAPCTRAQIAALLQRSCLCQ